MNKFTQTKNIAVSAGAGTGKTYTLSRRYINALLGFEFFCDGKTKKFSKSKAEKEAALPPEILSITYTDAAASEMKSRINSLIFDIMKGIDGKKTGEKDVTDQLEAFSDAKDYIREKLANARRYMSRAKISTIHSFSRGLVRENAYLLRSALGSRIIDDIEKGEIIDQIKKEVIQSGEERYLASRFLLTRYRLDTLLDKYISDSRFRENFDRVAGARVSRKEMQAFLLKWKVTRNLQELYEALTVLDRLKDFEKKEGAWQVNKDWLLSNFNFSSSDAAKVCDRPNLRTWPFEQCQEYDRFKKLRDTVESLAINISNPVEKRFLQAMETVDSFLKEVFLQYRDHLKREGKTDFDMIIDGARELVLDHDVSVPFKYIMIDEFQDTSFYQWEVFKKLADTSGARLFLVGDEKQSIYSFQGAEVEVFGYAVKVSGSKRIPMGDNFRSSPAVIDFVNTLFASLFSQPVAEKPYLEDPELAAAADKLPPLTFNIPSITYEDLAPGGDNKKFKAVRPALLVDAPLAEDADAGDSEMEHVARFVHLIVEGKLPQYKKISDIISKGDTGIAVLFDATARMQRLNDSLKKKGISCRMYRDGEDLFATQEVLDVFHFLWTVENIQRQNGWKYFGKKTLFVVGALRSPYMGCKEDEIVKMLSQKDIETLTELTIWIEPSLKAMPISELIEYIVEEKGIPAYYRSLGEFGQKIANIEKLITFARQYGESGKSSLKDFLELLEKNIYERAGDDKAESEAEYDSGVTPLVILSTIHRSKGLQYPMVILVDCGKNLAGQSASEMFKHASIMVEENPVTTAGFNVGVPEEKDAPSPILYQGASEISKYQHWNEKKRLFYVALTRAKHALVFSVAHQKQRFSTSYLGMINERWPAIEESVAGFKEKLAGASETMSMKVGELDLSFIPEGDGGDVEGQPAAVPSTAKALKSFYNESAVASFVDVNRNWYAVGRSADVGTAFHETAAALMNNSSLKAQELVSVFSKRYSLEKEEVKNLHGYLKSFHAWERLDEIRKSSWVQTEYGYTGKDENGKPRQSIIDLVYLTDEGLVVVDYKTSSLGKKKPEEVVKSHGYDEQVSNYAKYLESATGHKVVEKVVFFVEGGVEVQVE